MSRDALVVVAMFLGMATAGCSEKPGALTIITVSGVVTTPDGPVANAKVKINDRPVVTTASDGTFSVSEVTVPYDAVVGYAATNSAVIYRGLTRANPDLNFGKLGVTAPPVRKTTIGGKVTAAGSVPLVSSTMISFGSTNFNVPIPNNFTGVNLTTGIYSKEVAWRGGSSLNGAVHALQWNYDASTLLPTEYTWHGSRAVTLDVGVPLSDQDVDMTALSAHSPVSGTVTVPTGYTVNSRWFEVYLAPDMARIPVFCEVTGTAPPCKTNTPIAATFDFFVPSVAGTTATVWVNAVNDSNADVFSQVRRCGILPGTSNVNVEVPLPPRPDQPDDLATQIGPGRSFAWTAFPVSGGIHALVILTPSAVAAGEVKTLMVYTAGNQVPLPDLEPVGLAWPASTGFAWGVTGYAPLTIDTWADPIIKSGCDFNDAVSASRTFTTNP